MKSTKDLLSKKVNVARFSDATRKQYNLDGKVFLSVSPRDVLTGGYDVVDSYTTSGGHGPEKKGQKVMWVALKDETTGEALVVKSTTHRQFSNGLRSQVETVSLSQVLADKAEREAGEAVVFAAEAKRHAAKEDKAASNKKKEEEYCKWNLHLIDGVKDFEFTEEGIEVTFDDGSVKTYSSPKDVK